MTPSNSSVHALARRSSQVSYQPARSENLLRRIFYRGAESDANSFNGGAPEESKQPNRPSDQAITPKEGERVTDLLHSTVLELWREEHAGSAQDFVGKNGAAGTPSERIVAREETAQLFANVPTWKRFLDVSFILLTSPLWLPLMLLLTLAVRLSSPGPIFYRQERIGFRGRKFMIYKFRSMKVDAETNVHEQHLERLMGASVPMAKLDGEGDPRILPWGRILRATGLDELPQIFNVLRGEMSMVGPRPCTVHEFARYAQWQRERVNALPGLTGYWQVNGKNKTTFNEMIEMDIYYANNLSPSLDLKIILQTLPALLAQTLESTAARRPRHSSRPQTNPEVNPS